MTNVSTSESEEVKDLKINLNITKGFLDLVEKIDSLPDMKKVRFTETRSLYQAVSKGREIETMEQELADYFGPPAKPAGKSLSLLLRLNPSIKYLDGIREEQILFIKKVKSGFYYGALWPWRRDPKQVTVHLGFCSPKISDKDFKKLEALVKSKVMHQQVFEKLDAGSGGQVQGISLASFLQMAAMEKITCKLKIQKDKDIGYLHLLKGNLIAAETGSLRSKQAAYKIISWDNTVIDIEPASGKTENEINQPVVNILLEAAKIREKAGLHKKKAPATAQVQKEITDSDQGAIIELADEVATDVDPVEKDVKIKKKRLTKITALAAVIILACGTFFALRFIKSRRVETEYQSAMAMAESQKGLKAKVRILQNFIDSHQQSEFAQNAVEKIIKIRSFFEKQDYQLTMSKVDKLTQSNNYAQITDAYRSYLKKHPRGIHAGAIRQKLKAISLLNDNSDYDKLIKSVQSNDVERIYTYVQYLKKHPNGKHRNEVKKLILNMSQEYYLFLQQEITGCSSQEDWEKCIRICDEFVKIYPDHKGAGEIKNFLVFAQESLKQKKILDGLKQNAERGGHDYGAAKKVYYDYLNSHPNSNLKDKIIIEITKLKEHEKLALLEREREKIEALLKEAGGRFVDNHDDTIKDTKTGLMWCELDSMFELNSCLNYEAAKEYVKALRTGGHQDWRLPTESELTEIYKKKPFFPLREAEWYWTSKSYSRYSDGWQQMVHIVTTKRETVWKNEQANAKECGAVQAVRP